MAVAASKIGITSIAYSLLSGGGAQMGSNASGHVCLSISQLKRGMEKLILQPEALSSWLYYDCTFLESQCPADCAVHKRFLSLRKVFWIFSLVIRRS